MGNRAVIATKKKNLGVYLHWNGGRDSVEAFLKYCELKGYRSPEVDGYGWARLSQVIGNFFGGTYSLGLDAYEELDTVNGDNGTYIIEDWKIIDRLYFSGKEQNEYDLEEMLVEIDKCQPEKEQLGDFLKSKDILVSELKIGDEVYIRTYNDKYEKHKVVGFGEDRTINGMNVKGVPYVDLYLNFNDATNQEDYTSNINNYITEETIKIV
ncbi:MAG: hypothetical protein IJ086_00595 [Clostridium sp.]|nr:hypothetical protein [Clostridium sp.]